MENMRYWKILFAAFTILFIGIVNHFYDDGDDGKVNRVEPQVVKRESIDIVKVPLISSAGKSLSVVKAKLESGSNLNDLLIEQGLSRDEASSVVYEISPFLNLRSIKAGELFQLDFIGDEFQSLSMNKSENTIIEVVRDLKAENGFRAFEKERLLQKYVKRVSGTIDTNLYDAAISSGMNVNILYEFIRLLSFDVDFQRDIQKGDTFDLSYETIYDEEGELVSEGRILSARLSTDGRDIKFYYYEDLQGDGDYYDEDGETIRKTLLKTPIPGAYITSNYGLRVSPITGFTHMHRALDFGAPSGTPIYASGNGVVIKASYNSVYGNFVQLRHVNGYTTLYAHMTNYARGIRIGTHVDQGQVIGYVGTTGMSTGPHLHYEVAYYGTKVNPNTVKSPPGRTLTGDDLKLFENLKKSYIASFR